MMILKINSLLKSSSLPKSKMKKLDGKIVKYYPDRKFGFIQTKNSRDVFFHIREFHPKREPIINESIIFELGEDRYGRICAVNIQTSFPKTTHTQARHVAKTQSKQTSQKQNKTYQEYQRKHNILNITCAFSILFIIILIWIIYSLKLSYNILIWYAIINIISFMIYQYDKNQAKSNQWRVSENILHKIDILGGWIGASFAHKIFNHKTTKYDFRSIFYLNIFININISVLLIVICLMLK